MALLEIRNLSRAFGGLRAVDGVSLDVSRGQIKAVIGPNGAGKTTLFNLVCGALNPHGGTVTFDGAPVHGLPPHRIAGLGMSRTFQNIKLYHHMSVADSVMVGMHPRGRSGILSAMLRLPRVRREEREFRARAQEAMELFGIAHLSHHDATALSFGQQRSVEFARALVSRPQVLLLDEPAAGLNIHETSTLAGQITRIRDSGVTILLVEHDMSLVMSISDEIAVLSSGRKIAEGRPREIQANREVISVYLGADDA